MTAIKNQGAGGIEEGSRIESIEKIDMATETGANTLTLTVNDVIDMGGMNLFNSGNGWVGLAATVSKHQIVVDGDGADSLIINTGSGAWAKLATVTATHGGKTYNVYENLASNSQILVDNRVTVTNNDPVIYLSNIAAGVGGFSITGEATSNSSGYSVSSARDVNGDGLDDLLVGAYGASGNIGRSYVVFGKNSDTLAVNLATIAGGTGGFAINGEAVSSSGYSVSSAGDVNGDGLADLIVGAKGYNVVDGKSYVVFGKKIDTLAVNLSAVAGGTGGFAINAEAASDNSGYSVSSAGDVNGDGLADLIVGAKGNSSSAGSSYIVFGKNSDTLAINLANVAIAGGGGFAIDGEAANDNSGYSVSSAGDVNGDGLADLIVGAYGGNDTPNADAGRSYVVYGKSDFAAINLTTVATAGGGGFAINGEVANDNSGYSVSSAGDVNGDGLADLIVGAKENSSGAGRSYVVFGKSNVTAVSLADITATTGGGFAINGEVANDNSGVSVSSAGDVNGDGLADLIVGAFSSDTGATNAGRSYVVYGKSDFATVNLSTIAAGTGGFAINGETASNSSGFSVSSAGDVNGDGLADLIVGAYVYGTSTGRSYVIFGGTEWLTTSVSATGAVTGTGAAEAIVGSSSADTLTGGGGIDRFFAGDGDDVIVLESSDITNLADIATGSPKAAINGGGDIDTIRLSGVASLDLSTIANQGAGGIEENSRIESIEKIDMATDAGVNALIIKVDDVKDMSGMNLFNSVGWTGLAATVAKHQLIVIGGANDTLTIAEGNGQFVLSGGTASDGTNTYNIYDNTALNAQILVLGVGSITNSDILP